MGDDPAPPVITLSAPVELPSGKYRVDVHVSNEPTLTHRKIGETPEEADSKAREFLHARLCKFYRSLAAKHYRAARRIACARKAAPGANMESQAGARTQKGPGAVSDTEALHFPRTNR